MVAASLNLLAFLNPKTSTPGNAQAHAEASAKADSGRDFARLIKESSESKHREGSDAFKPRVSQKDDAGFHGARPVDRDSKFTRAEWKQVDREITPREASKALKVIEARETSSSKLDADIDPQVLAEVKAKLKAIVDSGKAAPMSDVLAAATGQDPKLFVGIFANANAQATEEVAALTGAVKKVLGFLDKALTAASKADEELAADIAADANVVLSADGTQLTQIIPASNTVLVPKVEAATTATAAPVDAITDISDTTKAVSIDTLVPALALTKEEKQVALPDIELPSMDISAKGDAKAAANIDADAAAAAAQQAPAQPSNLERQLQALNDNRQFIALGTVKDENAAANAPKVAANNTNVSAITGVQGAAASGALTGSAAVTAAANVAGNLINHAPIREQVHVAISRAAKEGVEQITIALEPQGLGRVEVKMHTGRDGQTQISFLVDKPETFDALSRDARGLERVLQDTGLKTDSGGMQFNLRQQANSDHGNHSGAEQHASLRGEADVTATTNEAPVTRHYRVGVQEGVDIHA